MKPSRAGRLYQALQVEGVASAAPVYIELRNGEFRSLPEALVSREGDGGLNRQIRVVAFNPKDRIFRDPAINGSSKELEKEDRALFDSASRDIYGPVQTGGRAELTGRQLRIAGSFRLGPDFLQHGNLIMSDVDLVRFFPQRSLGSPSLGLVRLSHGPEKVVQALRGHARRRRRLYPLGDPQPRKAVFSDRDAHGDCVWPGACGRLRGRRGQLQPGPFHRRG